MALYNRSQDAQLYLDPIKKKDGLKITGEAREGFAKLKKVTSNIEEAVSDADIIFIATLAFAHDSEFLESASYLKKGQVVMVDTSYCGCLRLANLARSKGFKKDIILWETSILVYSCRIAGPAEVHVDGIKHEDLKAAALPSERTGEMFDALKELYPSFIPDKNVLECDLENLNFCSHTSIMILNIGRIEASGGDFLFLPGGTTPPSAR